MQIFREAEVLGFRKIALYLFFFFLIAFVLYWPSLSGGWYLDDFSSIVLNDRLKHFGSTFSGFFSPRSLAFLSFSSDYHLFGMTPARFRLVNVFLHAITSFLVFLLVNRVLGERDGSLASLFSGLVFLCHPLQTQAVNYVVQRMAVLSGLFFLLSLMLFFRWLDFCKKGGRSGLLWLFAAIISGMLSVSAKENTVLLPLVIFAYLYSKKANGAFSRNVWLWSLLFFVIPMYAVGLQFASRGSIFEAMQSVPFFVENSSASGFHLTELNPENLHLRFLLSQLQVLWVYLRLIIFPVGQALDYCWPLPPLGFDGAMWASVFFLSGVVWLAFTHIKKRPVVFFAVAWVVLTLIVESGPFPIDPIFEHRFYLPLVGVILLFSELVVKRLPVLAQLPFWVCVIVVLSLLTWKRNLTWAQPIVFWESNVQVVPKAPRPRLQLGFEYFRAARYSDAANELGRVQNVESGEGREYAEALFFAGEKERAFEVFRQIEKINPYDNSVLLYRGVDAFLRGDGGLARQFLLDAKKKAPEDARVFYYLGQVDESEGKLFDAAIKFQKALSRARLVKGQNPLRVALLRDEAAAARQRVLTLLERDLVEQQQAFVSSGNLQFRVTYTNRLLEMGLFEQALANYRELMSSAPSLWFIYYNAGIACQKLGDFDRAEEYYLESLQVGPARPIVQNNLGSLYLELGRVREAKEVLLRSVEIDPGYGEVQFNLAKAYYLLGDKPMAKSRFSHVYKSFPELRNEASRYLDELR